jgi:PAS domain S-box-containing protein
MAELSLESILANIAYYTNDSVVITEAEPVDEPGPRIIFVNPTFMHVTGYHGSEVIGKNPRILQGPYTSESVRSDIRKALKAWRPITAELLNYKKDGTPFWNELSIVPVSDDTGQYRYWVAVQRDTTDLRQHQQDLNMRSLAMDASTHAIAVCEMEGDVPKVVYGNKPFINLLGDDSISGFAFLNMLEGRRRQDIVAALHAGVHRGHSHVSEGPIVTPAGHSIYARITIDPVPPELSGVKLLMINIRDKTEEQAQKEEVAQAQRMRALGLVTGGIAHDFNNLLTIVTHCSEILLEKACLDDDSRDLIQTIAQTADRGASLTSQLLSFARRRPLEARPIPIRSFLERIQFVLRRIIPSAIDIDMSIAPDIANVLADPTQLETALLNLVINARDAIHSKGVIRLVAVNKTLDAEAAGHREMQPGSYVSLSVIDDGPGMHPDVLARVFEPFFTTKDVGQGSGLGLSMVYGFARQSNGNASIVSSVGHGTRVEILLPQSAGEAVEEFASEAGANAPDLRSLTVLVVEDDATVLKQVHDLVRSIGCRTYVASTGDEALSILSRYDGIDLLFTDVVMAGGVSGVQLARQALSLKPDLKVLFTSGYSEEDQNVMKALSEGAPLLRKPYRRAALTQALSRVCLHLDE